MIRQLLASFAVLAAAAFAWLYFAPGAPQILTNAGIVLPFGPQAQAAPAPRPADPASAPAVHKPPADPAVVADRVVPAVGPAPAPPM